MDVAVVMWLWNIGGRCGYGCECDCFRDSRRTGNESCGEVWMYGAGPSQTQAQAGRWKWELWRGMDVAVRLVRCDCDYA